MRGSCAPAASTEPPCGLQTNLAASNVVSTICNYTAALDVHIQISASKCMYVCMYVSIPLDGCVNDIILKTYA